MNECVPKMSSDAKQKIRVHFHSSCRAESWLVYSAVLLYLIKVSDFKEY